MKERPIIFSGAMVRPILNLKPGTREPIEPSKPIKWQTRRIMKPQPAFGDEGCWHFDGNATGDAFHYASEKHFRNGAPLDFAPYGQPGDRLWVRETWASNTMRKGEVFYRAEEKDFGLRWRPSIHMPRWASRITLEVTGVRVERLKEISEEDAKAEGVEPSLFPNSAGHFRTYGVWHDKLGQQTSRAEFSFRTLWESIHSAESWASNPWVWVVEFKKAEATNGSSHD